MFDIIFEFIGQVIVDVIGWKILVPFFRLIGGGIRWLLCFGKTSYQDILNKSYNARIGFVFFLILIISLIYIIKK